MISTISTQDPMSRKGDEADVNDPRPSPDWFPPPKRCESISSWPVKIDLTDQKVLRADTYSPTSTVTRNKVGFSSQITFSSLSDDAERNDFSSKFSTQELPTHSCH